MKRIFLLATIAAGILTLGTSCLKSGTTESPENGAFLLSNASPDAPPLNVSLNSNSFGNNLTYGFSTPYYLQTAGSYTVSFNTSSNQNIVSKTVTLAPNSYYSFFVVDSFSKAKLAFVQDNIIVPGADSVYLRFFNFSPDAGPLTFRDTAAIPTISYSSRNFNDQETTSSNATFKRFKAGIYTLQLQTPDGAVIANRKDTLQSGFVYTYFAKGFLKGSGDTSIGIAKIINLGN